METVSCDLCHCKTAVPIYQVSDTNYGLPGTFTLVQCPKCELVYLNPRPTADEISKYYLSASYHPFRALRQNNNNGPNMTHRHRAKAITRLHGQGHILDVGCGSGLFLQAMQERGWAIHGVEPDVDASHFSRETLGLDVITGDIFDVPSHSSYAAISFWDVLEHTHSPQKVLRQAKTLLEDNGLLAINVPNWASWERQIFKERWIALDTPRHLYHFSPDVLRAYMRVCGFEIISLRTKAPVMSPASNVLRVMGDTILRSGQIKSQLERKEGRETAVTPRPSFVKQTLIRLTYAALTLPNVLANAAHRGGSIIVFARKTEGMP